MEIKLNIGNIRGPIKLLPWGKKTPPNPSGNLMNSIVSFARFMALDSIPQATLARLQNDELFRICFAPAASSSSQFYDAIFGKHLRERLLILLNDPDKITDKDLHRGFGAYLNNFHCLMPEGYMRKPAYLDPETDRPYFTTFSQIDEILREKGLMERAVELGNKNLVKLSYTPEEYKDKIEHWKICLAVFNEMIRRYGYKRYDLTK